MFQTLLFCHILAVAGLFGGLTLEVLTLIRVQRSLSVADARAATLNVPITGPIIVTSVVLLLAAGAGMIFVGGFSWNSAWIITAFALLVVLTIIGAAFVGRSFEAIHAAAYGGSDADALTRIERIRRNPAFTYAMFFIVFETIAALYVMVAKPDSFAHCAAIVIAAAIVALLPTAFILSRVRAVASQVTS